MRGSIGVLFLVLMSYFCPLPSVPLRSAGWGWGPSDGMLSGQRLRKGNEDGQELHQMLALTAAKHASRKPTSRGVREGRRETGSHHGRNVLPRCTGKTLSKTAT